MFKRCFFKVKDKVTIPGIGRGWVSSVSKDSNGVDLYSILMEDSKATPDGQYLARLVEIVEGWPCNQLQKLGSK